MKYVDLKHALLSSGTIEFHNPPARVQQMVTILHCAGIVSIVENVETWRVTLTRKPTVNETLTVASEPVADVATATPLAVVEKPSFARIRLADKIRYVDGKRIVSEQWSGQAYTITGTQGDYTLLEYGSGVIGRLSQNIKIA